MPTYICRWPNGDVSIVQARSKREAIIRLDEVGNADYADFAKLDAILLDFSLTDEGRLVLNASGERTEEEIFGFAFPDLSETLLSEELQELDTDSPEYRAIVLEAVEHERKRGIQKKRKPPKEPATERGKELQEATRAATAVVDYWIEMAAEKVLEEVDDDVVH